MARPSGSNAFADNGRVGLPRPQAGLPRPQAGLPRLQAGLPRLQAGNAPLP